MCWNDTIPSLRPNPSFVDSNSPGEENPVFDFYKEMRITRVTVDQMLKDGKIEAAEAYMKERRAFLLGTWLSWTA